MKLRYVTGDQREVKILLLPFCLSHNEQESIRVLAESHGYRVVVSRTTAYALSQVRAAAREMRGSPVRIVGVVCDGRAKKVALGLFFLKSRQYVRSLLGFKTRRIILARVGIEGGTRTMFGRRQCHVGKNSVNRNDLILALKGGRVFFLL